MMVYPKVKAVQPLDDYRLQVDVYKRQCVSKGYSNGAQEAQGDRV